MVDVIQVELSKVLHLSNYRLAYDQAFIEDTASDMATNGYDPTWPMKVYRKGDHYIVIDGNTRWNAAQLAQVYDIKTRQANPFLVWVSVNEKPDNDGEFVMQQIEANKSRRDTDPISDGRAFKRALDAGKTVSEIARRAHTNVLAVNNRMALLSLTEDIQELVIKGHFPLSFAAAMANLDSNRQHIALLAYNKARSPNINDFKEKCSELYTAQVAESQTSFMALFSAEEMAAKAEEMANSISSEPKKSLKALEAELDAERKARRNDRAYAKQKFLEAQQEIAKLKAELYGKGLAA